MTEIPVTPGGTPKWTRDATANDSDKSFTVPAGKRWEMRGIFADFTTTATVGNRVLGILITNGTNDILPRFLTASVAASKTATMRMMFGVGIPVSTTAYPQMGASSNADFSATMGQIPVTLEAGYIIRVADVAAIDAAADDLTVVLHYIEYEA